MDNPLASYLGGNLDVQGKGKVTLWYRIQGKVNKEERREDKIE